MKCEYENGTLVSDSSCSERNEKPTYVSDCEEKYDCEKYRRMFMINTNTNPKGNNEQESDQLSVSGLYTYSNWSKCSAKCGYGTRTRTFKCSPRDDSTIELPMSFCSSDRVSRLEMPCHLVNCTYKLIEKWSKVNIYIFLFEYYKIISKKVVFLFLIINLQNTVDFHYKKFKNFDV